MDLEDIEQEIEEKESKTEDFVKKYAPEGYYFMKCACGLFVTDYPFVAECCKCGYKGSGSSEEIEKWKKEGILIKILDPKTIPAKKRIELIEGYEEQCYGEDYEDELYGDDDLYDDFYEDIMGL